MNRRQAEFYKALRGEPTPIRGTSIMKTFRLFCLALVVAASAMTGSARADSAAVANYKQAVARIVDTWNAQMSHFNDELTKAKADLDALKKKSPPPADLDKQVAAIQTNIKNIQASMDLATRMANVDLGLLTVESANESDIKDASDYSTNYVKSKGIKIGNNVTISPYLKIKGKTKAGALTITITFR
jgi:Skp family chaperone for outer membrane proteins